MQTGNDLSFDFFRDICPKLLADTDNVLGSPGHLTDDFCKFRTVNLADGALLRRRISLVNIAAYRANPFFHNDISF